MKYTLEKFTIYNNIRYNLFGNFTTTKFIVEFFNTILHYNPHQIYMLLRQIEFDIIEYNSNKNNIFSLTKQNVFTKILNGLDKEHKLYSKYKKILTQKINSDDSFFNFNYNEEYDLDEDEQKCFFCVLN